MIGREFDLAALERACTGDTAGLSGGRLLGAQGANVGTRFLASAEAPCPDDWKQAILAAESEDAIKADVWWEVFPRSGAGGYDTAPRSLRTPFLEDWQARPAAARREAERLQAEIMTGAQGGRMAAFVPFAGQSAGMIREVLPAAEAEFALTGGATVVTAPAPA